MDWATVGLRPPLDWGHHWTGPPPPCGAIEGPVGGNGRPSDGGRGTLPQVGLSTARHSVPCSAVRRPETVGLKLGPSSFCNDLCNNLTTKQKGTKRKAGSIDRQHGGACALSEDPVGCGVGHGDDCVAAAVTDEARHDAGPADVRAVAVDVGTEDRDGVV